MLLTSKKTKWTAKKRTNTNKKTPQLHFWMQSPSATHWHLQLFPSRKSHFHLKHTQISRNKVCEQPPSHCPPSLIEDIREEIGNSSLSSVQRRIHRSVASPVTKGAAVAPGAHSDQLESTVWFLHIDGLLLEWPLHSLLLCSPRPSCTSNIFFFPFVLLNQNWQQHHLLKCRSHW